jgi:hypothetical protein
MSLKIVRIDENREAQYQEYVAGYNFAKHARAKNKQVSPEEVAQMSPAFKQGYRKGLMEGSVMEGPMDFMRGMAGHVGNKVAQSAPVQNIKRGVGDVVQAGRTASAVGDLSKQVQQLAQLMLQIGQLQKAAQQAAPAQAAPAQQAPAQQAPAQSASPEAFRTSGKPKGRMGQHGFEYTFSSYIQDLSGEQINEGMWDFVKGAGGVVADKAREKISAYAERNKGFLNKVADAGKEMWQAGRDASTAGDAKKAAAQLEQVRQQAKQVLGQIVAQVAKLGDNGDAVLKKAVATLPPQHQQKVYDTIKAKA